MALQPVKSLRFTLVRVIWDPDASELVIIYDREVDGRGDRASEILQFGLEGRVVRGEVFYQIRFCERAPASHVWPIGSPFGTLTERTRRCSHTLSADIPSAIICNAARSRVGSTSHSRQPSCRCLEARDLGGFHQVVSLRPRCLEIQSGLTVPTSTSRARRRASVTPIQAASPTPRLTSTIRRDIANLWGGQPDGSAPSLWVRSGNG